MRPGKPSNQDVLEEDVTCVGKTGWETLGEMRQKNRNLPGWCRDCGCLGQVLWNDLERCVHRSGGAVQAASPDKRKKIGTTQRSRTL